MARNGFAGTNFTQRAFAGPLSVWEQSTCCICCCYCFWSAPRRDCLKSAITMCLVRFSVCQLIGYCCCYYLPIQKKSVFFLLRIILVCSVWAEKYFSHWQISSLFWSGQFLKWILLYFSSIICLIILLTYMHWNHLYTKLPKWASFLI